MKPLHRTAMANLRSPYLIGIDLGTSTVKVAAFGVDGELLGLVRSPTPTVRLPGGLAEHDPAAVWRTVAGLIRELQTVVPRGLEPVAVATASVGEAGVPVDGEGEPLRPIIAWFDTRSRAQAQWWTEAVGPDTIHRVTGHSIDPHYGVNKLMWVRDNEPDVFARTAKWLSMADFTTNRLAGVLVTDRSLASRTMVYDQAADGWATELLAEAGLNASIMPPIVAAGTVVGQVTAEAARVTGLPSGTAVVAGGHDRLCGAFAARGGTESAIDSTGSAEALVVPLPTYDKRGAVESGDVACYADVVPGRYVYSARCGYAGSLLDWFRTSLQGSDGRSVGGNEELVDEIPQPLAFSGLLVFPSFGRVITPFWDVAAAPGLIAGLTLATDRGRLVQAFLEGVTYSLRANIELVETLGTTQLPTLRVEGGVARNAVWMQLKADIVGRAIDVVSLPEATALGVALLAGVGVGVFPDHRTAGAAVQTPVERVEPEPARAATYAAVFRDAYLHVPGAMARVNHALIDATRESRVPEDG